MSQIINAQPRRDKEDEEKEEKGENSDENRKRIFFQKEKISIPPSLAYPRPQTLSKKAQSIHLLTLFFASRSTCAAISNCRHTSLPSLHAIIAAV